MIVDEEYFTKVFGGELPATFARLNAASQSFVEFLTSSTADELLGLSAVVLERVKQAICSEIEYLDVLGGVNALNGKPNVQKKSESYGGSYSYSLDDKQLAEIRYTNGIPHAPLVDAILAPTGLLYAGRSYV